MNDALKNILNRNSPRELSKPYPSKAEMETIYQAALRAPDHAWQRPSRFIQVTGKGLEKLSSIFVDFAKDNDKLTIVGGSMDGKTLDKAGVEALATMPSLDELRGKLVGLIQAPASKLARVTQAPAGKVARVVQARADQLQQG